jgi:8-oxo-dGTP pyrophosphatase MutT (NUDIX family)
MIERRTARVLLFEPGGSVLLVRFSIPRAGEEVVFWVTPGGEIEPGETESEAAQREVFEELGLRLRVEGPIRTESNVFFHQGAMRDNTDLFFRASCDRSEPRLYGVTPDEIAIMKEIRWWSAAEIESAAETIYPRDLGPWIRQLLSAI